ncbi:MAG: tRNA-specific adenosine deaminase [Candidatus Hinthialibacteria bacterium OLB16]|nr:MAG: tRNA-specific adenosine deaminase [Candidatus Hinthialibacteria bacterium OLB16]
MNGADEKWMEMALDLAHQAAELGEAPIGAIVVRNRVVVGQGYNRREVDVDPTAHAELIAIREAAQTLRNWRLDDCTLYVTLEPCIQCCGSILLSRIPKIVFGAEDPKAGGVRSLYRLLEDGRLNHRAEITGGVLADRCGAVLSAFFEGLRKTRR